MRHSVSKEDSQTEAERVEWEISADVICGGLREKEKGWKVALDRDQICGQEYIYTELVCACMENKWIQRQRLRQRRLYFLNWKCRKDGREPVGDAETREKQRGERCPWGDMETASSAP